MYATCHTSGCGNERVPIPIPEGSASIICGVCSQPITDLTTTPPALPTEVPTWLE